MRRTTQKLLHSFYSTFVYRDPRLFYKAWKQIKNAWDAMPQPEKHKAQKRMRAMLERYQIASAKVQKALPNITAIAAAAKLLEQNSLPQIAADYPMTQPEDIAGLEITTS